MGIYCVVYFKAIAFFLLYIENLYIQTVSFYLIAYENATFCFDRSLKLSPQMASLVLTVF